MTSDSMSKDCNALYDSNEDEEFENSGWMMAELFKGIHHLM